MGDRPSDPSAASGLLASQRRYYDERAPDYGDPSKPSDRGTRGLMHPELARMLVDEFRPVGRVLELACGTGGFTSDLARHADSLTAVDGAARMLEIAERRVDARNVEYVLSDIFEFRPDATYDAVFFGFWLSHVPPTLFEDFWDLVRRSLSPGGRVAFVDEDDRAAGHDDVRSVEGIPAAVRRLSDGREFEIVKVFWRPDDLEDRLRTCGWDIDVRRVGENYLYGVGSAPDR
jgi:SAM-dependent methyltransferase